MNRLAAAEFDRLEKLHKQYWKLLCPVCSNDPNVPQRMCVTCEGKGVVLVERKP